MCYPADHPNGTFIPNWALWWLLELDAYRARTGDEETVAASRAKIGPLLAWFDRYAGAVHVQGVASRHAVGASPVAAAKVREK